MILQLVIPRAPLAAGVAAAHWAATLLGASAAVDDGLPGVPCAALPPHASPAARGNILRREGAIEGRVPLASDGWVESGKVVVTDEHFFIGTVRASAATHGAAGDDRLVVVVFFAAPPYFFIGRWGYLCRYKASVFIRVPLGGNVRIESGEIVEPRQHFFASVDRTATAVDTAGNAGLVIMTFLATPPHFATGTWHHVGRSESAVFRWVPLRGKVWIKTCEIVVPRLNLLISANGTTSTIDTGFHLCPPLVTLLTAPPSHAMAAWQNVVGDKVTVFLGMPFTCNERIQGGKIIYTGNGIAPTAIGTS